MEFSSTTLEKQLLESAAGQAVYDSLVQANVDVRHVSLETVKQMLVAECKYRKAVQITDSERLLAVC